MQGSGWVVWWFLSTDTGSQEALPRNIESRRNSQYKGLGESVTLQGRARMLGCTNGDRGKAQD